MKEYLERANEELRRADHLIYVSLKYTRTADVLQSIIERLLRAFRFAELALLKYLKDKGKIEVIPDNVIARLKMIKEFFPNDEIGTLINLFMVMRRISKEEPVKSNEFRRGVRMSFVLGDYVISIDIDSIEEYYKEVEKFLRIASKIIETDDVTPDVLNDIVKEVKVDLDFERG